MALEIENPINPASKCNCESQSLIRAALDSARKNAAIISVNAQQNTNEIPDDRNTLKASGNNATNPVDPPARKVAITFIPQSSEQIQAAEAAKKEAAYAAKSAEVNLIPETTKRVDEWAKFVLKENYSDDNKYYVVVDKKKCSATVFDVDGKEVKTYGVLVGEEESDKFNCQSTAFGKVHHTTPPGEFTLSYNDYGDKNYGKHEKDGVTFRSLSFGEDSMVAADTVHAASLHQTPADLTNKRNPLYKEKDLKKHRASFGCVNFQFTDYEELYKNYVGGGTKVYVLPEEADNSLVVNKDEKTGEYKMVQTKHTRYETD